MLIRLQKRWRKSLAWLRGWWHARVTLAFHVLTGTPINDLTIFQRRIPFIERNEYSQNGEDGMIAAIFAMIGKTNRYFVEFGAEDGMQCNTRYLSKHKGWTGLLMDGAHRPGTNVKQEFITAENINDLFAKHGVPEEFDLLSIDIDGNDYWVWKAIDAGYSPRVIVIEYNACIPALPAVTIPYKADFVWDKTDYYGASLGALDSLARGKGYTLIATDGNGVNAFFVRNDLIDKKFIVQSLEETYHPAAFKGIPGKKHPPDTTKRLWVTITATGG